MGDSYLEAVSIKVDLIRLFLSLVLDRPAYGLLSIMYQIFFNVASADLFSNNTIMKFYGRVQLILGVFMMFQLAMTIIRGIVNPDSFFGNDKNGGAGNLIMRICTALFMLTILVPINIPSPKNEYETQLNNNGLLFGTLYSLQYRLLSNNTLGRLILGTNDDDTNYVSTSKTAKENLKTSANIFSSTILKGFYRINLIQEESRKHIDGKSDDMINSNRVCQSGVDDIINIYKQIDVDPQYIISMVNESCEGDSSKLSLLGQFVNFFSSRLADNRFYVFAYNGLISAIVAFVFAFILLSFSIDVAVRAVKLAVLRLIAPIPIISYMDPKGAKDSAFNAWVKTLASTYLDLFVRLAVVYFVIFLIQEMMVNGIIINHGSGVVGVVSYIIIWIGLFVFAKQAPKFFRKALGLKEDGGKFFSGFGEIGSAIGLGASAVGAIGSARAGYRASKMADETRESLEGLAPGTISGRTANRAKHLLAGIAGGFSGGYTGAHAALTAKDHGFHAAVEAMRKRNQDALTRGNDGSTLLGRWGSTASNIFTGEGRAAAMDRQIASMESRQKALDAIGSRVSGEMVKKDWTFGAARKGHVDTTGHSLDNVLFNYKNFTAQMEQSKASGSSTVTVRDNNGNAHTIDYATAELMKGQILQSNENNYINLARNATFVAADGNTYNDQQDIELVSLIRDAEAKGGSGWNGTSYSSKTHGRITSRDDYKKSSEGLGQDIRESKRENMVNTANDSYSGKKNG